MTSLAQLKERAGKLGITSEEAKDYGPINAKASWQSAISDTEERRHKESAGRAYQSASAPVVVPLAFGAAVATTVLRNAHGFLTRK